MTNQLLDKHGVLLTNLYSIWLPKNYKTIQIMDKRQKQSHNYFF